MKKICSIVLICIMCMSVLPVYADTEVVDYRQIYMDFVKEAETDMDHYLNGPISGLILMDFNRDDVPELLVFATTRYRYDKDGNPVYAFDDDDRVAYTEEDHRIVTAYSIKDGTVVNDPFLQHSTYSTTIPMPCLPNEVGKGNRDLFCYTAQYCGARECLIMTYQYMDDTYYNELWYDEENGFEYLIEDYTETFFDYYSVVNVPVAYTHFLGNKSEKMEQLLDEYEKKVVDVNNASEWARETVQQAKNVGLVPQELLFLDYTKTISRDQFTAIAITLLEQITGREYMYRGGIPFEDVEYSALGYYIAKACNASIVTGISENEFGPFDKLTREQLATMLCRVIKSAEDENYIIENDADYPLDIANVELFTDDASISDYAKESVYYMNKMQITKGVGENCFAPQETATIEEAIAFALRVYNLYANK